MFVKEFFHLNDDAVDTLYSWKPKFGFNGYGEIVYYRTFSRRKQNGKMETWNDTCLRVINGIMSIRKNHYIANNINWDEEYWQTYAFRMLESMFNMEWLPPGRGLWQCGTSFMYIRGSASLNNCGFTEITMTTMHDDIAWAMDMLMLGVGVGFRLNRTHGGQPTLFKPTGTFLYSVPDTREGWAHSVRLLIAAYINRAQKYPIFDYSQVRKPNQMIHGFGGTSSGPDPLRVLHERIHKEFARYIDGEIDEIELQANIANAIAVCVLAGNVRRSAEILQCEVEDNTFFLLKDDSVKPERLDISWTSNNSCIFTNKESFKLIGRIADRVAKKGEPGGINQMNLIYGRLSPKDIMAVKNGQIRRDKARGFNPCGEQQLEHRELCCLVNTFPTMCYNQDTRTFDKDRWLKAVEYATFYAQTVTLLPTHDSTTNAVMQRNRRIGVAITDFTGWVENEELHNVINYLKEGYTYVKYCADEYADEAGVPHCIRYTTIKPDGTGAKLPGKTSGAGYPTFRFTLRRTRFSRTSSIGKVLIDAGVPHEPDVMQPETTTVFEYPILQGPAVPVSEVSIWQQMMNIILLQRYWSDNAVSNTIYFEPDKYIVAKFDYTSKWYPNGPDFKPELIKKATPYIDKCKYKIEIEFKFDSNNVPYGVELYYDNPKSETHLIEYVISTMMPMVKSFSLLPKSGPGVYPQMPESELSEEEYNERLDAIKPIDWSKVTGEEAVGVKFCTNEGCEV